LYRVDFKNDLAPGKSLSFEVEVVLTNSLKPYPSEITQAERQYVLYKGNHYFYSLYQTKTQTSNVNLASDKVESYSQLKPTSKSDTTITYGPYENVKPFEQVIRLKMQALNGIHNQKFYLIYLERDEHPL
jgi:oligosaccharyltransferase complex subunit alpha (ribophorin I)